MTHAYGFVFLLFGFGIILVIAARNRAIAGPLVIGFGCRAAIAIVDAYLFRFPGQDDGEAFDYVGYYWAKDGVVGTFQHIVTGAHLYTWLCSFFYALFGRSRLMMQALNVLFGTLIVLNVARLNEVIGNDRRLAQRAAWLTAIFPSLVFFSAAMLREVAVAYPLSLGVLYLVCWHRDRKHRHMVAAVLSLLASMAFHSGVFAILLIGGLWLVGGWLRSVSVGRLRNFGKNSLALLAGIAAILFVLGSGFGMEKFQHVESGDVQELSQAQINFAHGRTAYLEDLHADGPADVVWQAPIRITYFLFSPFPWMLSTGSDVVGLVDSCFFLALFWRLWTHRRAVLGQPQALMVLGCFSAMALTFAIGVSNYGTAHRHRNKMLPLLVGVAMGFPRRRTAMGVVPIAATVQSVGPPGQLAVNLVSNSRVDVHRAH